jgi:hydroxymethylglutaryl-CoA lyase
MANSSEILTHLLTSQAKSPAPIYQFLVPNIKGLDNFLSTYHANNHTAAKSTSTAAESETHAPYEVSIFAAATEAFSQKNINCSIAESLERFKPVFANAKTHGIPVRAYISVAMGCPYEGPDVDPKRVADLAVDLLELGASEISIGDTTGMGTATKTRKLFKTLAAAGVEMQDVALHCHDTYGQALVNIVVGLEAGVRVFDSAVGGLGGCPYSPGATGNVATEDLVYLLESLGVSTGVNLGELSKIGDWITKEVGKKNESRVGKALLARTKA